MSNPNTNSKLKTLCRTAIFLALLVAVQFVTRSMGQYVTGSLVNLILIASGLLCGLWGGLAVALLSPVCAFLIGIGPAFPQIVPAIMLGNAVIVLVWHLIAGGQNTRLPGYLLAAAAGALAKFVVLYLVIGQQVKLLVEHRLRQCIERYSHIRREVRFLRELQCPTKKRGEFC